MGLNFTQRRRGAEKKFLVHSSVSPCLCVSIFLCTLFSSVSDAAELDPVKFALLVDGMASKGSGYDAVELHGLGVDGLTAVLDYLLPDTAPPPPPKEPAVP